MHVAFDASRERLTNNYERSVQSKRVQPRALLSGRYSPVVNGSVLANVTAEKHEATRKR